MKENRAQKSNKNPTLFLVTKHVVGINYISGFPQLTAEMISRTKGCSRSIDHLLTTRDKGCDKKDRDAFGTTIEYRSCFLYSVQRDRPAKCQSCHLLEDSIVRDWPATAATGGRACKESEQTNKKRRKQSNSRSKTETETKNKTKIKEKLLKM